MNTSRTKTEFERRMEVLRRRESSKAKLRRVFAAVVSNLESVTASVTGLRHQELLAAKDAVEKVARRIEANGQPTVNVSELLDLRSPSYGQTVNLLHSLEARTILQFCSTPLAQLKIRFRERGIDFPVQLEMLHAEYRRE